jgi:tetratricopeptide (TPR) repeat protein
MDSIHDRSNLVGLYLRMHMYDEAKEQFEIALRILNDNVGKTHPDYIQTAARLGNVYASQKKYQKAVDQYDSILDTQKKVVGYNNLTLEIISNLASCLCHLDQHDKALEMLEFSIQKGLELGLTDDSLLIINMHINIANVMNGLNRLVEAKDIYEKYLKKMVAIVGENAYSCQVVMFNILGCYRRLGEISKADALQRRMDYIFG